MRVGLGQMGERPPHMAWRGAVTFMPPTGEDEIHPYGTGIHVSAQAFNWIH